MTAHATMNGELLLFKIEDPANPGTFLHPCTINTDRKLDFTSDVYSAQVGDCSNPGGPKVTKRRVKGRDISFTGAGLGEPVSVKAMITAWDAGEPVSAKAIQDLGAGIGMTITADWVLESMSIGGMDGEFQQFDAKFSLADDYTLTWD